MKNNVISKALTRSASFALAVILSMMLIPPVSVAWAVGNAGDNLMAPQSAEGIQIIEPGVHFDDHGLDPAEVVVWFKLNESIDLNYADPNSVADVNIEFVVDGPYGRIATTYTAGKGMAGYLSSYPEGISWRDADSSTAVTRYSPSEEGDEDYEITVPAKTELSHHIFASSGSNKVLIGGIEVDENYVIAATITVTGNDGSKNWVTVYSDGRDPSWRTNHRIIDPESGVVIEFEPLVMSVAAEVSAIKVDPVEQVYDQVKSILSDYDGFVLYRFNVHNGIQRVSLEESRLDLTAPVEVYVPLENYTDLGELEFVAYDVAEDKILPASLQNPNYGVFETDHFSYYAFAWRAAPLANSTTPSAAIPATGDSLMPLIITGVVLLAGLGSIALYQGLRKRSRSEQISR